jgi:hypothetical protein
MEYEADVRPGRGELSRTASLVIDFGMFAHGKPLRRNRPREDNRENRIPAPRQAQVPGNATRRQ